MSVFGYAYGVGLETYPCVDRRDCIPDIREIVRF